MSFSTNTSKTQILANVFISVWMFHLFQFCMQDKLTFWHL